MVMIYCDGVDCKSSLGRLMQAFRCDRPNEWQMDEFIGAAEYMSEVNDALMTALVDFVLIAERDLRGLELIRPELEQAKAAIEKANGVKK
jgi:hypothetical protein